MRSARARASIASESIQLTGVLGAIAYLGKKAGATVLTHFAVNRPFDCPGRPAGTTSDKAKDAQNRLTARSRPGVTLPIRVVSGRIWKSQIGVNLTGVSP